MAIKKLQNNFTTPEQSKRLLELGVPADSADCYYSYYIKTYAHSEYREILWHILRFITEDNIPNWNARLMDGTQTYLPCWSVGRLIEILFICCDERYMKINKYFALISLVDYTISTFELCVKNGIIDFSKLED